MEVSPQPSGPGIPLKVEIAVGDFQFRGTLSLPVLPTRPKELVPLALSLTDAMAEDARRRVEETGKTVSCKKGCAACCRYLVHLSESEAYFLYELVERMPEPRRRQVRERFALARRQLEQAGFLRTLWQFPTWTGREIRERSLAYQELQVQCPFLEEESCSIYADRPVACREYMVSSPPEHCGTDLAAIQVISVPVSFVVGLARFGVPADARSLYRWVPLVLALEWVESHPDTNPSSPAEQLLDQFIQNLGMRSPAERPSTAPGRTR